MIIERIRSIPEEVKDILLLFCTTRLVLVIIGVCSRLIGWNYPSPQDGRVYSVVSWLNIWGQWDSKWYRRIAEGWYPPHLTLNGENVYAFMPFYPWLMKGVAFFCHNYFIAGVIISNTALLVSSIVLYKLVKLEYPRKVASDSVLFLYLFPTAFILSGVLTESLFLMLSLLSFYFAKKDKWFLSAIAGFLMTLTKSQGILILIPLVYVYLKQRSFAFDQIRWDILFLILILLGPIIYYIHSYYLTGDGFVYFHVQDRFWHYGTHSVSPLINIQKGLLGNNIFMVMGIWSTVVMLFFLLISVNSLRFEYWIYAGITFFLPLIAFNFDWVFQSMLRFGLVIFPFYIFFALLSRSENVRTALIISLALLQGFFMVFWAKSYQLVI